jgi:pimeloyl-ACP methyl ester carboxylesterase
MKVYFIPGLGFDSRIFRNLRLVGANVEYIDWIEPTSNKENISAYAARLATSIDQQSESVILIGHSFGGVICHEIAKIKKVHKIILISSIKSRKELPFNFKILRPLGLHKLFTKSLALITFKFWGSYQGYKSKEEKELFVSMFNKQSDIYLRWALGQLSVWNNHGLSATTDIIQIHGDLDKTFPVTIIENPDVIVANGDHFMIYKQPDILSEILNKEIIKQKHLYLL